MARTSQDSSKFYDTILDYNQLVEKLTYTWLAFFVFAIILWIIFRALVWKRRQEWNEAYTKATEQWSRDLWDEDSKPILERKTFLINQQRISFEEIAKPLERYVWVFFLFLPPVILLATSYCVHHSGEGKYACSNSAEMVISFRSIGTVTVYFWVSNLNIYFGIISHFALKYVALCIDT